MMPLKILQRVGECKLDAYYINHMPIQIAYITIPNLMYHRLGSPIYHHLFIYIMF
jgi:hypothetical protein